MSLIFSIDPFRHQLPASSAFQDEFSNGLSTRNGRAVPTPIPFPEPNPTLSWSEDVSPDSWDLMSKIGLMEILLRHTRSLIHSHPIPSVTPLKCVCRAAVPTLQQKGLGALFIPNNISSLIRSGRFDHCVCACKRDRLCSAHTTWSLGEVSTDYVNLRSLTEHPAGEDYDHPTSPKI